MISSANGASVTIMDVAAAAGVSRSTVSRVVNGSTSVSPEAQRAVTRAIADLNYVPNRAARSLASRQTLAIGLIVPEETTRFFGDPYFATIISGISDRIVESSYVLNLLLARNDFGHKMASYIRGGNIDGAIIVSHHTSDTFIEQIVASVPVVYGGRPVQWGPDHYFVDVDNVAGSRRATEYLISRGYQRIGTITGPTTMPAAMDRLAGYRQAIAAAGLAEGPMADGRFTADGGAVAMTRILESDAPRPDAIFVASDLMASGALTVLRTLGIRVPDDIALMGFDDSPIATTMTPALSTVRQPSYEAGQTVADVLLSLLAGGDAPHETILPTELVIREST